MITGVQRCLRCGNDLYGITYGGYCSFCWALITQKSNYNYKCPQCQGEFNEPARYPTLKSRCPFCGRVMEGL